MGNGVTVSSFMGSKLINVQGVADMLGISKRCVNRWAASKPEFPKPVRQGPRVTRWDVLDVQQYIDGLKGGNN